MAGMLDLLHSTSGFTSENSLSGVPTPPYTPARTLRAGKRSRLERSDSPASLSGSIHPHETTSPAIKPAKKRLAVDNIKVEELPEDVGYMGDVDGILPYETESADSSDTDHNVDDDDTATDNSGDEAAGLARKLSQMDCTSEREAFLQERQRRRQRERRPGNFTKRTHSRANESMAEPTDIEALADHDYEATKRRLRRRTRGPDEFDFDATQLPASPPNAEQYSPAPASVVGEKIAGGLPLAGEALIVEEPSTAGEPSIVGEPSVVGESSVVGEPLIVGESPIVGESSMLGEPMLGEPMLGEPMLGEPSIAVGPAAMDLDDTR